MYHTTAQLLAAVEDLDEMLNFIQTARSGLAAEKAICAQYRNRLDEEDRRSNPEHVRSSRR